jgi:NAD(P)-dependent dehydrogenase (short-subunit alcohol dehydrogenase family)
MTASQKGAVLVTGTSAGIGRAIALLLDQSGYRVFAAVRREEDAVKLREEASGRLVPVLMDVTKPDQIAKAMKAIETALGPDDGLIALINNAGVAVAGPLEFLPLEDIRRTLEVNVIGQVAVIQAALALVRRGHGRIIQVTSGARSFGMPFLGAYVASKAGLGAICDTLRRELRSWKIPVVEILPGFVKTPMWDKYRSPADQLQSSMPGYAKNQADALAKGRGLFEKMATHGNTPEKVAERVRQALEAGHPKIRYIVGFDSRMGMLLPRIIPTRILDWLVHLALG